MRVKGRGIMMPPTTSDEALSYKNWVKPRINRETGAYEKHLPWGNYVGPGTDIIRRVAEGIKPTSKTDRAAQRHDIDYYNIRSGLRRAVITPNQARARVRQSDNLLMQEARRGISNITNPLNMAHGAATLSGIRSKTVGENLNVIDPLLFVGKGVKGVKDPLAKLRRKMIQ